MEFRDIGCSIRELRERTGMSQADLAIKANIAQSTLSYIEAGKKSPTYDTLTSIARGLNMSLLDVLKYTEGMPADTSSPVIDVKTAAKLEAFSSMTAEDFLRISTMSQLLYTQLKNTDSGEAQEGENDGQE